MSPLPAPSASRRRPQSGRLRWPFAWLLACLLTAGMLALLAGVVRPQGVREAVGRLQVALSAPQAASEQPPAVAGSRQLPRAPGSERPAAPLLSTPAALSAAQRAGGHPAPVTDLLPLETATTPGATRIEPAARGSGPASTTPLPSAPPQTLAQQCPVQVKPVFPAHALEEGIERGRVLARLHLDSEGRVREVSIIEASPRGVFEAATRAAARQWRCLPAAEAGESVRVPFEFGS